jgi:hypothetical protein
LRNKTPEAIAASGPDANASGPDANASGPDANASGPDAIPRRQASNCLEAAIAMRFERELYLVYEH